MITRGELRLARDAAPASAGIIRRALCAFMTALDIDDTAQIVVVTAVGEALANAIEHAYAEPGAGELELYARIEGTRTLRVEVTDRESRRESADEGAARSSDQ